VLAVLEAMIDEIRFTEAARRRDVRSPGDGALSL